MFVKPEGLLVYIKLELMFFITRYNLKIVISILIFTFYIINQVLIFNFYIALLVLRIFLIKSGITEVLE